MIFNFKLSYLKLHYSLLEILSIRNENINVKCIILMIHTNSNLLMYYFKITEFFNSTVLIFLNKYLIHFTYGCQVCDMRILYNNKIIV